MAVKSGGRGGKKGPAKGENKGSNRSEDRELWVYVTKSVKPLPGKKAALSEPPPPPGRKRGVTEPVHVAVLPIVPPVLPRKPGAHSDRRTAEKFRGGEMKVAGRLDLHGMTQGDAHEALFRFIPASYAAGRRCVLIITGKGKGVLRARVPQWLALPELADMILSTAPAQLRHGGDGALYVLLKRKR